MAYAIKHYTADTKVAWDYTAKSDGYVIIIPRSHPKEDVVVVPISFTELSDAIRCMNVLNGGNGTTVNLKIGEYAKKHNF